MKLRTRIFLLLVGLPMMARAQNGALLPQLTKQAKCQVSAQDELTRLLAARADTLKKELNITALEDKLSQELLITRAEAHERLMKALEPAAQAPRPDSTRPKYAEQLAANIANDRLSVTEHVVAVPVKNFLGIRSRFRIQLNQVKTDASSGDTSSKGRSLRLGIETMQRLIDNGGAYWAGLAMEGGVTCGQENQITYSFNAGLGALPDFANAGQQRYTGSLSADWLGKYGLSQIPGELDIMFGGRAAVIESFSGELIQGGRRRMLPFIQAFGVIRLYGASALTLNFTSVGSSKELAHKFTIGINTARP